MSYIRKLLSRLPQPVQLVILVFLTMVVISAFFAFLGIFFWIGLDSGQIKIESQGEPLDWTTEGSMIRFAIAGAVVTVIWVVLNWKQVKDSTFISS